MAPISLQAKKAHAASKRRSNYAASLRLEGFATSAEDAEKPLPAKEDVLKAFLKHAR
ncbi:MULTISPECIES: YhfG family protein [Pseudomonas]|uniref:YhfG family protein n=1 Tax=Pseudomonas TaxID=286 RepID=UPI000AC7448F|nr:YhfG family protein [Pseudomonas sp. 10-1B]